MDKKIKGIGPATEKLLLKMGIDSIGKLVNTLPRRYEVLPPITPISNVVIGETMAICATMKSRINFGEKVTTLRLADSTGNITALWFFAPFTVKTLRPNTEFVFHGEISEFNGTLQIKQPMIYEKAYYTQTQGNMEPVYPLTEGLKQFTMRKAVNGALELYNESDDMPNDIKSELKLMDLKSAYINVHHPQNENYLRDALRRLKFDEFFYFRLGVNMGSIKGLSSYCPMTIRTRVDDIENNLPFKLTNGQKKAWEDIKKDITSEYCMSRLIQGDVGCGKSIIAFLSLFLTVENHYQGALLAPTEVLAKQHYDEILSLIEKLDLPYRATLLTGSTKDKSKVYDDIFHGETDIIIGTHAIFSEKVKYKKLGLVISDEQHRFGVAQRHALREKGEEPHTLLMSATPIPRSLGLVLYGGMDISIIDELPANRLPNKNLLLNKEDAIKGWSFIYKEVKKGHQAYIICPMVEENEDLDIENVNTYAEKLRNAFPDGIKVDILHGKMSAEDKKRVMDDFQNNRTNVLVSTTVIEVGVNVPNATVMMVENAERFGLSQLHQLRGRVGRGKFQGYCIFISGKNEEVERLKVITSTNNGFIIAEEDLKLRGIGNLLGDKQSGVGMFKVGNPDEDKELFEIAIKKADKLVNDDPELKNHQELLKHL